MKNIQVKKQTYEEQSLFESKETIGIYADPDPDPDPQH
jgi:hypothetical protein